jgi:hypothetical protein
LGKLKLTVLQLGKQNDILRAQARAQGSVNTENMTMLRDRDNDIVNLKAQIEDNDLTIKAQKKLLERLRAQRKALLSYVFLTDNWP